MSRFFDADEVNPIPDSDGYERKKFIRDCILAMLRGGSGFTYTTERLVDKAFDLVARVEFQEEQRS